MYEEEITLPSIRFEEEEEAENDESSIGFSAKLSNSKEEKSVSKIFPPELAEFISQLMNERRIILENNKLSTRDKLKLLETNRKALVIARGGTVRQTENVVYGILLFGGVVVVILALLTTFAGLPAEVTLSFLGTVLGGTIATIAQKLGKL